MKLYNVAYSGNSYKVRLLLAHLRTPCEIIEVDILKGESRTAKFLKNNPNGRTPVLDDNGFILAESNAILAYLTKGTKFLPDDRQKFALIFQWMFFEQYSHEPYVAVLKFWTRWGGLHNKRPDEIELWRKRGQAALGVMSDHLAKHAWFTGERYGIADIALFAYTQSAGEIGYDVDARLGAWLERVKAQPGYVAIRS